MHKANFSLSVVSLYLPVIKNYNLRLKKADTTGEHEKKKAHVSVIIKFF